MLRKEIPWSVQLSSNVRATEMSAVIGNLVLRHSLDMLSANGPETPLAFAIH